MARLWHGGAEIDVAGATNDPDGTISGTVTRDTVTFRSGLAAWKCDSGAGNAAASVASPTIATASITNYYRIYVNVSAAPGTAAPILAGAGNLEVARLRTDGGVEYASLSPGGVVGSASASIADGTWHRIEIKHVYDASGNVTAAELRLDGATVQTWTGSSNLGTTASIRAGWVTAPGANTVFYVDDFAINSSGGASNNTWCGDGKVVLLKPVADSAVGGSWTDSGASATGLFGSVDNEPPTGIADTTTNAGHQIRNAGANTSYDAQLGAYSDAVASGGGGMKTLDIVNAVIPVVTAASIVVTGAKTGSFGIVSNPAITNRVFTGGTSAAANFWSGSAAGTYPTGWRWEVGTLTEAPSVTLGTKPVARLTITGGTTSRVALSCCIGLYVEFTPSKSLAHSPRRRNLVIR